MTVDLDLTPDQELLADTTRKFLQTTVPLTAVRGLAENPDGFDRGWWLRGAELGWTSLLVDERRGGGSVSEAGLRDLALVAEEMGAMVSPGPLLATNVVAQTLSREASEELASHVLPGLISGQSVAAWYVAEPGRDITADGMTMQVRRDGADFILDGVKGPVEAGGQADWFLVTATGPEGLSQFLVPSSTPGLRITPLNGLDLVRRHAEIGFDGVRVPSSAVVGVIGRARAVVRGTAADRPGAAVRRDGWRDRPRLRFHSSVRVRPFVLRPRAGVLPSAQASLRRHETVA